MDGPIPGESLTKEPRAAQYERPPKFADPNKAFEAYLDKFDDPEKLENLMTVLETGIPLSSLVTIMTREAVRAGIHSIDTAVILRPMVHEYLSLLAKEADITFIEDVGAAAEPKQKEEIRTNDIKRRVKNQLASTNFMEEKTDDLEATEYDIENLENEKDDDEFLDEDSVEELAAAASLMKRPE